MDDSVSSKLHTLGQLNYDTNQHNPNNHSNYKSNKGHHLIWLKFGNFI